ncbi:JmjC domain-containing protein 7 [Symbiodinium microadriaticum]|uniref:JmjC domain-containing protein 7 n=1 Tax=Symbiodinium microadriaticum TaxID=2951 RepID=A0A1Q9EFI2_SYMMI|nr:JmjC domain-containing protein 7 [Symbiodinium microadriaticum]
MRSGIAVERVAAADLTPDSFVQKYVVENTPVILTGALPKSWETALSWTPERLLEMAPTDAVVKVAPLPADGRDKWVESADLWPDSEAEPLPGVVRSDVVLAVAASRIEVPMSDFVASLRGHQAMPACYADGAGNMQHSFSFLQSQLEGFPPLGESLIFNRTDMWLGGKTLSTLHFDNYENLFVQLVGEKEFVLCPPGDTDLLVHGRLRKAYATWEQTESGKGTPGSFKRTSSGLSSEAVMNYAAYDLDNPPSEYAEQAAKLRRTVVTVRPGEVLYLPFAWWHQVQASPARCGLCASVAAFFAPFFVRLQPRSLSTTGPLLLNPKYRQLCQRLGLDSDSEDEA